MLRSSSRGWNTKLWAICGVLAIVSLSLVLAAGCASGAGGSPAQTQLSGSAKMHTYNAAPADEVGARFFYANPAEVPDDDPNTDWDDTRVVWSTAETIPSVAAGKIGLETAPYSASPGGNPSFVKTCDDGMVRPKWIKLIAQAKVHVVNNWTGTPITIRTVKALREDLVYDLPTMEEINDATRDKDTLYDWLYAGPDRYREDCAKFLFPNKWPLKQAEYEKGWETAFKNAMKLRMEDEHVSFYLRSMAVDASTIQNETIQPGARSSQPMTVTLEYYGREWASQQVPPANYPKWDDIKGEMLAVAFSTYFGVTVDFTYPPDP